MPRSGRQRKKAGDEYKAAADLNPDMNTFPLIKYAIEQNSIVRSLAMRRMLWRICSMTPKNEVDSRKNGRSKSAPSAAWLAEVGLGDEAKGEKDLMAINTPQAWYEAAKKAHEPSGFDGRRRCRTGNALPLDNTYEPVPAPGLSFRRRWGWERRKKPPNSSNRPWPSIPTTRLFSFMQAAFRPNRRRRGPAIRN